MKVATKFFKHIVLTLYPTSLDRKSVQLYGVFTDCRV